MPTTKSLEKVGNDLTTKNEVKEFQVQLKQDLNIVSDQMGIKFTEYGLKCVDDAISAVIIGCYNNGIKFTEINKVLLRTQLRYVGNLELSCSAGEAFLDFRKGKYEIVDDKTGEVTIVEGYNVTIRTQGAGNEKLTRKYGVGIKKGTGLHPAILIREGDEWELPQFDGLEITPFRYRPKIENLNNKVIAVCYPVEKDDENNTVEYLIATRESVKANLIAQIRNSALYKFTESYEYTDKYGKVRKGQKVDKDKRDSFYKELDSKTENMTLQEVIDNYADYINPTYTSGGSKEAMIIRKMKNNALKNYPKEYDNSFIREAVDGLNEDKDVSLDEAPRAVRKNNVVENVEEQLKEDPKVEGAAQDFKVDEQGEVIDVDSKDKTPSPEPQEEVKEEKPVDDKKGDDPTGDDDLPY